MGELDAGEPNGTSANFRSLRGTMWYLRGLAVSVTVLLTVAGAVAIKDMLRSARTSAQANAEHVADEVRGRVKMVEELIVAAAGTCGADTVGPVIVDIGPAASVTCSGAAAEAVPSGAEHLRIDGQTNTGVDVIGVVALDMVLPTHDVNNPPWVAVRDDDVVTPGFAQREPGGGDRGIAAAAAGLEIVSAQRTQVPVVGAVLIGAAGVVALSLTRLLFTRVGRPLTAMVEGRDIGSKATAEIERVAVEFDRVARDNRQLADAVLAAREAERVQIGQEMHDQPIQDLSAALLLLHGNTSCAPAEASVRSAVTSLRRISSDLLATRNEGDMVEAITRCVQRIIEHSNMSLTLDLDRVDASLVPVDVAAVVGRNTCELVRNAVDHSLGTLVNVTGGNDAGHLWIKVTDNGTGLGMHDIERAREAGHIGLASVGSLMRSVGGTVEFYNDGQGTSVVLEAPTGRNTDA